METQRRFIHPHDPNIMVIDVLDEKGQMIRTRNMKIKDEDYSKYRCNCCYMYLGGCQL